jgi:hypothetical protein
VNSVYSIRIYVDAELYWDILWVMFGEASDLTVDREGAAIVGATLNAGLVVSQADAVGSITVPDGASPWWPET